jgi:hypothetical protein
VSELQGVARFQFHEGKLEEFKRLAAQCLANQEARSATHELQLTPLAEN